MGVYNEAGTRITKGSFPSTPVTDPDPDIRVTEKLYRKTTFEGAEDATKTEGTKQQLLYNVGDVIQTSERDALFPTADITSLSPATGPQAGGTVVTATGTALDGVISVTVGGVAATAVTVLSPTSLRFTTPAGTAGAKNVVVIDDSGTFTETSAFTYS